MSTDLPKAPVEPASPETAGSEIEVASCPRCKESNVEFEQSGGPYNYSTATCKCCGYETGTNLAVRRGERARRKLVKFWNDERRRLREERREALERAETIAGWLGQIERRNGTFSERIRGVIREESTSEKTTFD